MNGLLFNADAAVAQTCFEHYSLEEFKFDACIGIINPEGQFKGAILLHSYQGYDLQLSYYGEWTLTPGIARALGQFILAEFDPARLTVIVSKRNKRLIRSCERFGWKLEGAQRCYYGKVDCNRNTGVRLVMFRETIERIAALQRSLKKVA